MYFVYFVSFVAFRSIDGQTNKKTHFIYIDLVNNLYVDIILYNYC